MAVLSWWICIIQAGDFSSQILMCMRHFDFSSFVSISQISWMLTSIVEWHDVHFFPFRSRKIIWFDSNLDSVHFFGLQDSWAWFWVHRCNPNKDTSNIPVKLLPMISEQREHAILGPIFLKIWSDLVILFVRIIFP